jgi:predicted dehydrogenase
MAELKRLRTIVIGVGHMGRFHAEKLAASDAAELIAVVDRDAGRAQAVATALGCRAVTDFRTLLGSIDAAFVAVPTAAHRQVVGACLDAGVHVLVEKPIARSIAEADELLALARAKGLALQVGHLERFNPAFVALAAQPGRPLLIDIERLAPFKARGTDVDVVLDLMIHDLDLVLALARAPVEHVSAAGYHVLSDAIDIANARIEFSDGCVASISASRVSQAPVRKLRVFRPELYVSADLHGHRLRMARKTGGGIEESEQAFERSDPLAVQTAAFLSAVRNRSAPLVSGEQGRQALALALQVGELVRARLARQEQAQ